MIDVNAVVSRIRPILADIRTVAMSTGARSALGAGRPDPFITISRETGAGAWTLAQHLVEHLKLLDPGHPPWSCWDRELIEKVSTDAHVARELVASLEESSHSWIEEFLTEISAARAHPTEMSVYRKAVQTIRALAQVGRVVIVGMGSVFVTRDMPGGLHVRLVAPLEHRIKHMMEYLNISEKAAAAHVKRSDSNRVAFYRRYFPKHVLTSETFAMTLNTARVSEDQAIAAIAGLVVRPRAAGEHRHDEQTTVAPADFASLTAE